MDVSLSVSERAEKGRAARSAVPRSAHAVFEPAESRADPVEVLHEPVPLAGLLEPARLDVPGPEMNRPEVHEALQCGPDVFGALRRGLEQRQRLVRQTTRPPGVREAHADLRHVRPGQPAGGSASTRLPAGSGR